MNNKRISHIHVNIQIHRLQTDLHYLFVCNSIIESRIIWVEKKKKKQKILVVDQTICLIDILWVIEIAYSIQIESMWLIVITFKRYATYNRKSTLKINGVCMCSDGDGDNAESMSHKNWDCWHWNVSRIRFEKKMNPNTNTQKAQ